jgi:hypothetical protein
MAREECQIESWRFTTVAELARAIVVLLETSDYKVIVRTASPQEYEQLSNELESCRTLGRVQISKTTWFREKKACV